MQVQRWSITARPKARYRRMSNEEIPESVQPDTEQPTIPPRNQSLDDPTIPPASASGDDATPAPKDPNATAVGDAVRHDESDTDATLAPRPDAGEATVGDRIKYFGDYELLEEIARGGMGVVFKARQINLNRIVALKMILAGQFAGQEDVQRFYTEAEAAAQLDHPGIVPIFEIGEHQGQHYFSMGYIEGKSLSHKVADGPLPPREAAELLQRICDAMAYAHERGVIHRDLKPANILIDANGQPKVTDFGLAKKTEADSDLTGTGQILGTPAYMPPEQASGKTDEVGPLADVYSLGAVLYCLLTGRPPHQAASPMDTLLQVLERDPLPPRQLNPNIPQDLESVCMKCLQKNPSHRYGDATELVHELGRFLSGEPTHARPIGSFRYAWNWYWHNLRRVAGALALSCCVFYAIYSAVLLTLTVVSMSRTTYWASLYVISPILVAITAVLIGSKCGVLTLRGHRLSLIGSVVILGFIAYQHIAASLNLGLDAETFLSDQSSYISTAYAHTLSIWFLVCIVTQIFAMLSSDRSSSGYTWSDDIAGLRQSGPLLLRAFGLVAIGLLVMQIGGSPLTPRGWISIAGGFLVAGGVLTAMRIR